MGCVDTYPKEHEAWSLLGLAVVPDDPTNLIRLAWNPRVLPGVAAAYDGASPMHRSIASAYLSHASPTSSPRAFMSPYALTDPGVPASDHFSVSDASSTGAR